MDMYVPWGGHFMHAFSLDIISFVTICLNIYFTFIFTKQISKGFLFQALFHILYFPLASIG